MKCTACAKELTKKETVFTEDKAPYCNNPFACSENHPNSVANIVKRGGAVNMFNEEQLEKNLFENLQVSAELKERIEKVATKPQSIRLNKVDISHYLIMLQETKELASISEAVRYCVNIAMNVEPIEGIVKAAPINIPVVPKSVNVNWDELTPTEVEQPHNEEEELTYPVPEEEDEEFTF